MPETFIGTLLRAPFSLRLRRFVIVGTVAVGVRMVLV